jgi:putative Ca2+/H+ antiporter (TMEM165/GDT1 family)
MFIETFLIAFGAVLILEFGDKTQLIVITLTTKYGDQKLAILLGFFSAILTISLIGVFLGNVIKEILPENLLSYIGAFLFIFIGIYAFYDYYKDRKEENHSEEDVKFKYVTGLKVIFSQTLAAIFLVEIGDKSQIFVVTLATQYTDLIAIALGATFAMTLLAVISILLGEVITKLIPESALKIFSAVLFLLIGVLILIF